MTFIDQGFRPWTPNRFRARFEAIGDRAAAARLGGIAFFASFAKERGATGSGSAVAFAALAALGAFLYRDWKSDTGFTNRRYLDLRQRLQYTLEHGADPGRQRRPAASRQFWGYF